MWASQIALIKPVHGQGYILIFLDRMHLFFTRVHFLFWQIGRVGGQYTTKSHILFYKYDDSLLIRGIRLSLKVVSPKLPLVLMFQSRGSGLKSHFFVAIIPKWIYVVVAITPKLIYLRQCLKWYLTTLKQRLLKHCYFK